MPCVLYPPTQLLSRHNAYFDNSGTSADLVTSALLYQLLCPCPCPSPALPFTPYPSPALPDPLSFSWTLTCRLFQEATYFLSHPPAYCSHDPSICGCQEPYECLFLSLFFVSAASDMKLPTSSFLCLPVTFYGERPHRFQHFLLLSGAACMAATHGAILSAQAFN